MPVTDEAVTQVLSRYGITILPLPDDWYLPDFFMGYNDEH